MNTQPSTLTINLPREKAKGYSWRLFCHILKWDCKENITLVLVILGINTFIYARISHTMLSILSNDYYKAGFAFFYFLLITSFTTVIFRKTIKTTRFFNASKTNKNHLRLVSFISPIFGLEGFVANVTFVILSNLVLFFIHCLLLHFVSGYNILPIKPQFFVFISFIFSFYCFSVFIMTLSLIPRKTATKTIVFISLVILYFLYGFLSVTLIAFALLSVTFIHFIFSGLGIVLLILAYYTWKRIQG